MNVRQRLRQGIEKVRNSIRYVNPEPVEAMLKGRRVRSQSTERAQKMSKEVVKIGCQKLIEKGS